MIFLNYTPFTLNSSISVVNDTTNLTLEVPSHLPTMAEFLVNLSNKYSDLDIKVHMPSEDFQKEFEQMTKELELNKYSENKINVEWI